MARPKKIWLAAQCWVTKTTQEVAQCAFLESGSIGIEIDDGLGPEEQRKYSHDGILLKAYFERTTDLAAVSHQLSNFFNACDLPPPDIKFDDVEEEDWQGSFVRSCKSFLVEPDIYIVPSFDESFKKSPETLFIEMDPENAFGTGQHQTTKLVLTAIREIMSTTMLPQRVLDVGTGSGILAILLKKLGALSVLATDIDEDSILTAGKNAQKNGVTIEALVVSENHLYENCHFDLVVANILAGVLIEMAKNLSACLRAKGMLVVSGILLSQAENVVNAYKAYGLDFIKQTVMNDWCALVFRRS